MPETTKATSAPVAAAIPEWLKGWESSTEHEVHVHQKSVGPYEKVRLYDFWFLGLRFQSATYSARESAKSDAARVPDSEMTGAGVCAELRDELVDAQRRVYQAYVRDCAIQSASPSEGGFKSWCGLHSLSGWQFRSGKHRLGAAIDLDYEYCPYVATKTGAVFGGESYRYKDRKGVYKEYSYEELEPVRSAAFEAYRNAVKFRYGDSAEPDMSHFRTNGKRESCEDAYDRVRKVHDAVRTYLNFGFKGWNKKYMSGSEAELTRPFRLGDEDDPGYFERYFRTYYGPLLQTVHPEWADKLYDDAFLASKRTQIQKDHEALRYVMVQGSLMKQGTGFVFSRSRDPCRGFLSLRKEVVVGLCVPAGEPGRSGLRWGGISFGARADGDMMHFDLGDRAERVKRATPDPNPDGYLYV